MEEFSHPYSLREAEQQLPSFSPNLSPQDYCFVTQAIQNYYRYQPTSLSPFKRVVDDFTEGSLQKMR